MNSKSVYSNLSNDDDDITFLTYSHMYENLDTGWLL